MIRSARRKRFGCARNGPVALLVSVLLASVGLSTAAPVSAAPTDTINVNFQSQTASTPAGYTADYGQPYDATRGFGWVNAAGTPIDLTGNGRDRGTPTDRRLATFVHMQLPTNAATHTGTGIWQLSVPNGTYSVTVSMGDGGKTNGTYCCLDSVERLTVENLLTINNFQPTAAAPFVSATVAVTVSDGLLTVDPTGGTNGKINYITVAPSTGPPTAPSPQVTGVSPASAATQVGLNASVNLDVNTPLNRDTISASSFKLIGPSGQVPGTYNSDAAGGTASFTPDANLAVNTIYTVQTNSALLTSTGASFAAFTSTFTTGTAPPPLSPYGFTESSTTAVAKPGVLALGPDGKLYVGTAGGKIYRYPRNADGSLGTPESIQPFGDRIITGLAFDPTDATKLWVTNNFDAYSNAPRFSGAISTIMLAPGAPFSNAVATAQDRIIGLPRSAHDHMTNGIAFGPDGKLYIAQGADTAYGAPDQYWGPRGEVPLSASVLVVDVHSASFPTTLNVNTDPVGTTEDAGSMPAVAYNPATGPLSVFAAGVRNPYSIVWGSNGSLYAPVNESAAGGATPAGPGNVPPAEKNVQAYTDYFTRIDAGKYYGHPNPSQGYYTLNGGNPTNAGDPYEVTEYPVGVSPDANYRQPDFAMGLHRSPDGVTQYASSTAFNGGLKGAMLTTEYSAGDDVVAVTLDSQGKAHAEAALPDANNPGQALLFDNPLGIASDPVSGVVYVSEYGDEGTYTAGDIAVLTPGIATPVPVTGTIRINFQPATAPVPTGFTVDSGAAFNGSSGWEDMSGAPLNFLANTRDRNSPLSPDQLHDTMVLMQTSSGGVNTTGQWAYSLPNGQYDVHVVVGDATATNSQDTINAESGTPNAVTIVNKFIPTTANLFDDVTARVTVSDGSLNLDPVGGTNTKLDYVEITPVTASTPDTVKPTASIALTGTNTSATAFTGDTTATVTASDNVGVTSTMYTLDGGLTMAYTAPVVVKADGPHTFVVTVQDAAGNVGTSTAMWTETHPAAVPFNGTAKINFQPANAPVPPGYVVDSGAAFNGTSGWEDLSGAPLDLTANTRDRNSSLSPDQLHDTMILMQATSGAGVTTPGQWAYVVPNGTYNVRVVVGDATALNSADTINAESNTPNAVTIINKFLPTSSNPFADVTKQVTVSDGVLNLDPVGGSNTKLDFVEISAASPPDTTPPTASIALTGPNTDATHFTGDTTATVTDADNVAVTSAFYTLDGGPSAAYTAPVVVTTDGTHTLLVTVMDAAGNSVTATTTWNEVHPPTATITLTGPNTDATHFTGDTTVTVASSGNNPVTNTSYTLDGGSPSAYTAPVVVTSDGTHTLVVSVQDSAGNTGTATSTWTELHDTTPPTAAIALTGPTTDNLNYTGDTTVAINPSDNVGVTSVMYSFDGFATEAPYLGPFVVTTDGPQTLSVAVQDAAGNTATVTQSWVESHPADAIPPTAAVTLSGPTTDGMNYTGDTTATLTASDNVGVTSQTYVLDGAGSIPYTTPIVVTASGSHTLVMTVMDAAGNHVTTTSTWTESHGPTATITLSGPTTDNTNYTGDTTATVSTSDNVAVTSTSYSLDNGPSTPYTQPIVVTTNGSHTLVVTAVDAANNTGTATKTWNETHPTGTPTFAISSPDDAILGSANPRLVYSTNQGKTTPAQAYTITNTGSGTLNITGLTLGGANSGSFTLDPNQPTTFTVAPGATAPVSVLFTPTAPTGCPTNSNLNAIANVERYATLTLTTNDPVTPTKSVDLSGINACGVEGGNEPILAQVTRALGYTTKVQPTTTDQRFLGPLRSIATSDEVQAPYFQRANTSLPVTINPVAHYSGRTVTSTPFLNTGWFLKTAATKTPCNPANGCNKLFGFDGDQAAPGPYTQNQKLFPVPDGVTSFSPTGAFGIYNGDGTGINFGDDGKNYAQTTKNVAATPAPDPYLHNLRVYPAYGPNRVLIPNTWIIAVDITRIPSYKNNDYQDVVLILRNAVLDTLVSVQPGAAGTTVNLAAGGTVSPTCAVTGFDAVLPNTAGNQCNAANIAFGSGGLNLTSTAGQMGNSVNTQQDALYKNFDASRTPFTVTTRVIGPITSLTTNYQQIAAFFGPDQDNYVKIEAEHNGSGTDPHLTMFYEEGGVGTTVQTVSVPSLTTASTLDLTIKGNTSVPDPIITGTQTDPYGLHGYPLHQLSVFYSINGGPQTQIGIIKSPADVTRWFSTSAKAGILVSGGGTTTPLTATFSSFGITAG